MGRRQLLIASLACTLAACGASGFQNETSDADTRAGRIERGRYLASIMDCAGCHNRGSFSPEPDRGHLEGGGVGFEVPGLGVFYPPNLTPHPETGLGRWSESDIVNAVRRGRRPDGRELSPAMPWRAYSALSDEDAVALASYLESLPPIANQVPAPSSPERAAAPYLSVLTPQGE